jgi:hypothetical protein
MTFIRKSLFVLIPLVSLELFSPCFVLCSDYDGLKVIPLKRTTFMTDGRKIAYPKTNSPEVTVVSVEMPPNTETGWHIHPVPVYAYVLAGELSSVLSLRTED